MTRTRRMRNESATGCKEVFRVFIFVCGHSQVSSFCGADADKLNDVMKKYNK